MSKKQNASAQKNAQKRNSRAKAKRASIARGKNAPMARMRNVFGDQPGGMDFDNVLNNAVRQINKGNVASGASYNSSDDMLTGVKKAASELFKMYSYLTLVAFMVNKKVIEHTFKIDLDEMSLNLMAMDNKVSRLMMLINDPDTDEGAVATEALDIGTDLQNYADVLYNEIANLEEHSLVIEETINRLSTEVDETDPTKARFKVLETLAYQKLAEVKLAQDAKAATPQPAEEVAEEPAVQ